MPNWTLCFQRLPATVLCAAVLAGCSGGDSSGGQASSVVDDIKRAVTSTMAEIPNAGKCGDDKAPPAEQIQDCNRVLADTTLNLFQRALAYSNRGVAYDQQGEFDSAIIDLDESIKLNPEDSYAYTNRGNVHAERGEYDLSIADLNQAIRLDPSNEWAFKDRGASWGYKEKYDRGISDVNQALRLNPKSGEAYYSRAQLYFYQGRFDLAAPDLDKAITLSGGDSWLTGDLGYPVLWAYLSRAHLGQKAEEELAAQSKMLLTAKWPAPVIDFYLGKMDVKTLLAKADGAESGDAVQWKCESRFYVGEWYLSRKHIPQARRYLEAARDACPPVFIEFHGSLAELKRLQ